MHPWLAKVGYEWMQEMSDPARSLASARETWQKQGRSAKWIEQRMTGQETRNKLTDYWAGLFEPRTQKITDESSCLLYNFFYSFRWQRNNYHNVFLFYCFPFTNASTTCGSASVETSPIWSVWFSAILRRMRRMILPERVFGRPGAN